MTDWPRVMVDVDDDRPARDDEVEYCGYCGTAALVGELKRHTEEKRCEDCCFRCQVCGDVEVFGRVEFCESCAMWAMGVEL